MPLLEYRCEHCGSFRELLRSLKDIGEDVSCLECSEKMKKIITTSHFSLKGDGWAKDGYK